MNEVGKYRKKPIVVEAVRWPCDLGVLSGWGCEVSDFDPEDGAIYVWNEPDNTFKEVPDGHWIVKGPHDGDFYPCEPEVFADTYETPRCVICQNIGCEYPIGGKCWLPCPVCGKDDCDMPIGGDCWISWSRDYADEDEDSEALKCL